ncbi:hypothetical protein CRG98_039685 [Punica granatum]|uniref:G-patch domain-containing protein n=1 Tax=Punica granatum TaxID=22663 RepID=A0A2I0I7F1_PUNGR|nr:hypothetical protein CRG98_039685 [Punica granatum]
MTYVPTVSPVSDPMPPPPAPTSVPFPPAAFLSTDPAMLTLPPLTIPTQSPIYTDLPPTVPPVAITQIPAPAAEPFSFQAPQTQMSVSYQTPPPLNIPPIEPGTPTHAAPAVPPTNFPPENEQEKRMKRMEETIRALQAEEAKTRLLASSIRDIKLHSQFRWTTPPHYVQPHQTPQAYFSTPPTVIQSQPPQQYPLVQVQQARPPALRPPQPAQRVPAPRTQQDSAAQPCSRKQYTNLPAPPSHIFGQLLAGYKIKTEAPGPRFDPSMHNQNLRCEFHQGAPGHTLDTCWRLRDKIQEMIDARQISFNEVKPPNVRANPLPDHGSGSGPSVNMISITAIDEEEDLQKASTPFAINYDPVEVAFAPIPFVIEVPAKEPYHGRVYQGPEPVDKGKAPATEFSTVPKAVSLSTKKVTDQEAEDFMKVIKASEYKVVEQMSKSPAHISLLALLLNSESHWNALLKVLTAAQVPKDTAPHRIEETKLKFFAESKLITVNDEEDYAVYKETAIPYISIGEDQNLPFHSFDTISVIRDYGEVSPSRTDRMIGKVLLKNNYVTGTGLGARAQGILRPIEMEEYRNRRGLGFRPSCHEIMQARRGKHLHRLAVYYGKLCRGIPVPPLSQFFAVPPQIMGGTSESPITETYDFSSDAVEAFLALPAIYAVTEETSSKVHIHLARKDEELTNWTSIPLYSAIVADV